MPARITGEQCQRCIDEGVVPARPAATGSLLCSQHERLARAFGSDVEQPREAWPIVEHEPENEPIVPPDLAVLAACEAIWQASEAA